MPTERVIEIPWMLMNLPQSGTILDVGSCGATYLTDIAQPGRALHCLDPLDCAGTMPSSVKFYQDSIIGNSLPRHLYDCVVLISALEHIGLPFYDQQPFELGDELAIAEVRDLLKPSGYALISVPAGVSKLTSWYRQYSPSDLKKLFRRWRVEISYWGYRDKRYEAISEAEVENYDYREVNGARYNANLPVDYGAGALACIIAYRP